ncbi:hypothetical protein [Actinomadura hibisca]|uniref:hypothetical protein n=1 Tax=Actinomadura hibisca TaxID=68565 RepID=UPI00082F8640|nr:hypothetical protein [Actinomadura hibisca]
MAAIAAVRKKEVWTARERLQQKALLASEEAGEGNVFWTVFGPTNVALHAMAVEMEAGETAEALRLADEIAITRCSSVERRASFRLELARGCEQRRDDHGVLLHLLEVERQAPEDMSYNPRCARSSTAVTLHSSVPALRAALTGATLDEPNTETSLPQSARCSGGSVQSSRSAPVVGVGQLG